MKLKLITIGIFANMVVMGCVSADQNDTANADTIQLDKSISTQDTIMYEDTTNMDTNSITNQTVSNSNIR